MNPQKTINSKISCSDIGLHSGKKVTMTLHPAKENTGIIFRRTDIDKEKSLITAKYSNVCQTNLGTVIKNEHEITVSTIEHFMAAIWGCGIDNLIIDIDASEVPIMDGSSASFVFLIECAGITEQNEPKKYIEILKEIKIEDGDKFVKISPAKEFSFDLVIDFEHKKIGQQKFSYKTGKNSFKNDIARARTFGFKHEIDYLHSIGLAQGGTLDNAILVDENGVVNENGLRYHNEFALHKALDFIGDVYLAQHKIFGHFEAFKSGHGLNNKALRELFNDKKAWRII